MADDFDPTPFYHNLNSFGQVQYSVGMLKNDFTYPIRSVDGGQTWDIIANGMEKIKPMMGFNKIQFLTQDIGYASGRRGRSMNAFYKTIDGGNNWVLVSEKPVNFDEYGSFESNQGMGITSPFQMINEYMGYKLSGVSKNFRLYKTIDGGKTWKISFDLSKAFTFHQLTPYNIGYIGLYDSTNKIALNSNMMAWSFYFINTTELIIGGSANYELRGGDITYKTAPFLLKINIKTLEYTIFDINCRKYQSNDEIFVINKIDSLLVAYTLTPTLSKTDYVYHTPCLQSNNGGDDWTYVGK